MGKSNTVLDVAEEESFTFDILTEGAKPWVDLANIYEPLADDQVILTFDYATTAPVAGGQLLYKTPGLMTDVKENFDDLAATYAEEGEPVYAKAYVNVSKGMKTLGFGSATDHGIRWYISATATASDVSNVLARNFRFITKDQMKAEGGKPLNGLEGDVNGDGEVTVADATFILNLMADEDNNPAGDVNGDGSVTVADYTYVLNIMADEE